jgi:hypothetical protein
MPTPPMLRPPAASPSRPRRSTPDPLVSLNVAALVVLASGLLIAGVLAVYDWKTPGAEAPLVLWLALIGGALLAIDVVVVGARHVRRLRLGL